MYFLSTFSETKNDLSDILVENSFKKYKFVSNTLLLLQRV